MLITINDEWIGLERYRDLEKGILRKLQRLEEANVYPQVVNSNAIDEVEREIGFSFTDEQRQAINNTIAHNVSIITGQAGTGKTNCIKAIIALYYTYSISLCSLGAKAADRIYELTGTKAYTIHKTLGFTNRGFKFNADNPMGYWVYILDETSMVNIEILYTYLSAIPEGAKVILIGDHRQLPPIGPGNAFRDLLSSSFSITRLTKIHRQEQASGIVIDANIILDNKLPLKMYKGWHTHGELKDMHYYISDDRQYMRNKAVQSFLRGAQQFGLDEVIMMVPMKDKGLNCTRELNKIISDLIIVDDVPFMLRGAHKFKLGDKVIQKENDYKGKDVINGEIGYISSIESDTFCINFGDRIITYTKHEIGEIELAYCLTLHSCQGDQWKMAITILDMTHYILLSNQLLYTAMTRARQQSIIIAESKALAIAVNKNMNQRNTFLQYLIKEQNDNSKNNK